MSGSARDHALALEAQRQTERIYAEWRARRDQLQSEYEGEVKHEEYTTRKAIAAVEAEFHRNMQVATANGPQTVAMVEEVMATKKDLKIKELENRLRDTRSKVQAHYEKQLLEHTTKFSDAIMAKMGPLAMYTAVSETMLDRSPAALEISRTHYIGSSNMPRQQFAIQPRPWHRQVHLIIQANH
jgi:hypothetical protein